MTDQKNVEAEPGGPVGPVAGSVTAPDPQLPRAHAAVRDPDDDPVDAWGRDSFPASDPPPNW